MIADIDPDIDRIRELCRPGVLPCAWHTAYLRVIVRDLARDDELADGANIEYSDDMIRAEFRALLAENPSLPVASCHAAELAAAVEAMGEPASSP